MLLALIDAAAILVSMGFFALGSYFDMKTREAPDRLWLLYGPLGVALTLTRLIVDPSMVILTLTSIGLTVLSALGLFYFGLCGGADAKALICLGTAIPLVPTYYRTLIGYAYPFFPIVVVIASFLCASLVAVWFGLQNLVRVVKKNELFKGLEHESRSKKLLATITGYTVTQTKLHSKFYLYPLEEVVGDSGGSHRSLRVFVSADQDRDQAVTQLTDELAKMGYVGKVWATPGLPHLLFMLMALVITLILGDPIFGTVIRLATHQ